MRDWINNNERVASIACAAIIIIGLIWTLTSLFGGPKDTGNSDLISDLSWYYDVTTGEAFQADWRQVPPIKSPDGNEGVRVSFFSCGTCGSGERFAGYYMKYTPQFKKRADADPSLFNATMGENCEGRLFSIDARTWVAAPNATDAGVLEHFRARCGSGILRRCP